MDEEKVRVLALAVQALASMVEYAVVMAVQYMELIGDDAVSDQVRQGCIAIMAQLDAIQASAIFHSRRKRKRKLKFLARKRLLDLDFFTMPRVGPFVEKMNTNYKKSIPVRKRVAVALFHLATGANYFIAAKRFSVGESTVFYCTTELCEILCSHFSHMVAYPQGDNLRKVMAGFKAISGLPNCVGAIACMHCRIKRPAGPHSADYLKQNSVHTIVTQAAVDSSTRVLSLATGFTGVVDDLGVLRLSSLYENIQTGRLFNGRTVDIEGVTIPGYLVGGPSYELKPWLILPYAGDDLDVVEDSFNSGHSQASQKVDSTFDALKSWGILSGVMQVDVPTAVHMIGAVCIIHNMLLDKLDPSEGDAHERDFMLEGSMQELVRSLDPDDEFTEDTQYANSVRDALATYLITM